MASGSLFKVGEEVLFTPQVGSFMDSEYKKYHGQRCVVVRKVDYKESNLFQRDYLVYVVFHDGKEMGVYEKRLTPLRRKEVSGEV